MVSLVVDNDKAFGFHIFAKHTTKHIAEIFLAIAAALFAIKRACLFALICLRLQGMVVGDGDTRRQSIYPMAVVLRYEKTLCVIILAVAIAGIRD